MTVGNMPDYTGMKTNSIKLATCFRLFCKNSLQLGPYDAFCTGLTTEQWLVREII
jgi:hypothetical protein